MVSKIDYEIQFIKDELVLETFPHLSKNELNNWLSALEWAKKNQGAIEE